MGARKPPTLTQAKVRVLHALKLAEGGINPSLGEHHFIKPFVTPATFWALENTGFVRVEDGRYYITDAGREELRHWP